MVGCRTTIYGGHSQTCRAKVEVQVFALAHKSVLTALITAVLAIGGCLPCQKLFAGEPSKKSCCNSRGECQRPSPEGPAKRTCNLQPADTQSEPQPHADRLVDGSVVDAVAPVPHYASVLYSSRVISEASFIDSSPPPLFLLNLSLLI